MDDLAGGSGHHDDVVDGLEKRAEVLLALPERLLDPTLFGDVARHHQLRHSVPASLDDRRQRQVEDGGVVVHPRDHGELRKTAGLTCLRVKGLRPHASQSLGDRLRTQMLQEGRARRIAVEHACVGVEDHNGVDQAVQNGRARNGKHIGGAEAGETDGEKQRRDAQAHRHEVDAV